MPPPNKQYIQNAYNALKDNLQGFSKTPEEFERLVVSDGQYRAKVYIALKENLNGFSKSQQEFDSAVYTPDVPQPASQSQQQPLPQSPVLTAGGYIKPEGTYNTQGQGEGNVEAKKRFTGVKETPQGRQVERVYESNTDFQPIQIKPPHTETPHTIPEGYKWQHPQQVKVGKSNLPDIKEAIDGMVDEKMKLHGNSDKGHEDFLREVYTNEYKNGNLVPVLNSDGKSVLKKPTAGVFDTFLNAINKAAIERADNSNLAALDTEGKIKYLEAKRVADDEDNAPVGNRILGFDAGQFGKGVNAVSNFGGENADMLAKGAVGAVVAPAIAPAAVGAAHFGSFLGIVDDVAKGGYSGQLQKTYHKLKQQNPQMTDHEAMNKAEKAALVGEAAGIATGAVLSGTPKLKADEGVVHDFISDLLKSSGKMGAVSGGEAAVNNIAEAGVGVHKSATEVINEIGEHAANGAAVGAAFHVLLNPIGAAKALLGKAQKVVASIPTEQVDEILMKGVNEGALPPEKAQEIKAAIIRPEEMNRPQESTIAPKEVTPTEEIKGAAVILPQNNREPNIVQVGKKEFQPEAKVAKNENAASVIMPNENRQPISNKPISGESEKEGENDIVDIESRWQAELKENKDLDFNYVFKNYPKEYFDTVAGKNAVKIFNNTHEERFRSGIDLINEKYEAQLAEMQKSKKQSRNKKTEERGNIEAELTSTVSNEPISAKEEKPATPIVDKKSEPSKEEKPAYTPVKSHKEIEPNDLVIWNSAIHGEDIYQVVNKRGDKFDLVNVKHKMNTIRGAEISDAEFKGKYNADTKAPETKQAAIDIPDMPVSDATKPQPINETTPIGIKVNSLIRGVEERDMKLYNFMSKRRFAKELDFDGEPKEGSDRVKFLKYRSQYLEAWLDKLGFHEQAGASDWADLFERVEDEYDANQKELETLGEIKTNKATQRIHEETLPETAINPAEEVKPEVKTENMGGGGEIAKPKEGGVDKAFTEVSDLNKMYAAAKTKYGEKKGAAIYEAANRLANPNENTIVEIKSNGVTVKEGNKFIFKPFGNTDANSKKWTLYKGIDVTDQYSPKSITEASGEKTATSEPATNVQSKPTTKVSKGLRAAAKKLREGDLPSFLKGDLPDGTAKQGFGGKDLAEAVAKGMEKVADIIDDVYNGKYTPEELAKAIDEGFSYIKSHYSENKAKMKDEAAIKEQFANYVKEAMGSADDEWTAIRQERLKQIDKVRSIYEKETGRTWGEIQQQAFESVAKDYPDKDLYGAVKARTEELAAKYDGKVDYNPTAKDLAVIQEFKRQTENKIQQSKERLDSDNDIVRKAAMTELESYDTDLVNAGKALFKREAGTAFGYRQSESKMDADYGLQLRRMQLMKAQGGEKLSEEQMKWTKARWEEEKAIFKKEQEVREGALRSEFEKQINDLKSEYDKKSKGAANTRNTSSKEKTLSQKGKDVANLIRKLKTDKGSLKVDFSLGTWDLAVEGIAKLVEGGATIAEAIDQLIKDKKIAFKAATDRTSFEDNLVSFLDNIANRETSLEKIKEMAEENKDTDISNDMVAKGHIRDFINSHIGEFEAKDILPEAANALQKILPDVTQKRLIEAFLKEGEFKQPTKMDLEGSLAAAKKELVGIAKLTEDIEDLEGLKGLRERGFANERERLGYEKTLLDEKERLIKEQGDRRRQILSENKKLETERNRQLKRVGELTDRLNKLKQGVRESKSKSPKIDTPEIEGLKNQIKKADADLRHAESEANRLAKEVQDRKDKIGELDANIARAKKGQQSIKTHRNKTDKAIDEELESKRRELKKTLNDNSTDAQKQADKLQRVKKKVEADIRAFKRKIADGEYVEREPVALKKEDVELIKLKKEKSKIEAVYKKEQHKIEEKNKSSMERIADFTRGLYVAALIGSPKTLAKVGAMSIMRPFSEALTKASFGKVFDVFFPSISKAAKRGGESSSSRSIQAGFGAYFKQMGEAKMNEIFDKSKKELDEAVVKYLTAKNDPSVDPKELKRLENDKDNKLISAMGNLAYKFIGGSSLQDAFRALFYRANNIEQSFGGIEEESFNDGNVLDKATYILNFIGRSHSALKTFSGRFSFAAGFMARLEAAAAEGVEITGDKIIEIGHESYLDFERGKYQQSNFISDKWNQITKAINQKLSENPEWNKYNKVASALMRSEIAITRVPVNILHEAVMEYTVGVFRAISMAQKALGSARRDAKLEGLVEGDDFKNRVRQIVSAMDEKQAATIARCFRKGGIGLGLYAFAAISGLIHFGSFPHMGQKKKKDDDELAKDELNPGQVEVGGVKLGEVASGIIEHVPALWAMFMGTGIAYIYHQDKDKGMSTTKAAWDALYTHLKIIEGNIPQSKIVQPTVIGENMVKSIKKRADDFGLIDIEENKTTGSSRGGRGSRGTSTRGRR